MKVKCAAIKTKSGQILEGRSHAAIIQSWNGVWEGGEQGFVTDDGIFVDRHEAAEIAFNAGQTKKQENILMSEDLTGDWPWTKKERKCTNSS